MGPSRSIRQEKEDIQYRKGRREVAAPIADNIILCVENPKDSTKNLLEFINEFGELAKQKFANKNHRVPLNNSMKGYQNSAIYNQQNKILR